MNVGVKELKNSLSKYLRVVREGESVFVTERGAVIAEIRRVSRRRRIDEEEAGLDALAAAGILTRGVGKLKLHKPLRLKRGARPASERLIEDRGE